MDTTVYNAISNMQVLSFYYDGGERIVEPHCYGVTTKGNEAVRAFQVDGYSSSGQMGWKMYDLAKASNIRMLEATFSSARDGYKRGDKNMKQMFIEI